MALRPSGTQPIAHAPVTSATCRPTSSLTFGAMPWSRFFRSPQTPQGHPHHSPAPSRWSTSVMRWCHATSRIRRFSSVLAPTPGGPGSIISWCGRSCTGNTTVLAGRPPSTAPRAMCGSWTSAERPRPAIRHLATSDALSLPVEPIGAAAPVYAVERLTEALRATTERLAAAGIDSFIIGGTLLAARREGRFFAHDKDVDLAVMADVTPRMLDAALLDDPNFMRVGRLPGERTTARLPIQRFRGR